MLSLAGSVVKLQRGAKVADVGCGLGASTILMAQAHPKSRFFGYDSHVGSIELARRRAAEAGVAERVTFEVAGATDFPGRNYDLVFCVPHSLSRRGPALGAQAGEFERRASGRVGGWLA